MARRRFVCSYYTQRICIRLRGVIIQTCDTFGGHEKKPRAPLRQSDATTGVIDLRRHAARTATAVERATAHVHSHVRGCRWVIWPCRPTQPTREPRRAPWPLQSSAGCRSKPPARGDPTCTQQRRAFPTRRLTQGTSPLETEPRIIDATEFRCPSRLWRHLERSPPEATPASRLRPFTHRQRQSKTTFSL